MSKPRYRWWGYIKSIIRNYPSLENRSCQGIVLRERQAVRSAVDQTLDMESGTERMKVIDLVFFKQTHTLEGAALMVPCSYDTAQKYHAQFIKLVARNFGLLD